MPFTLDTIHITAMAVMWIGGRGIVWGIVGDGWWRDGMRLYEEDWEDWGDWGRLVKIGGEAIA
jgi:hypothetical protein